MSKGAGTTQTTSSTSLPQFQQPYVNQILGESQRLYGQPGPNLYGGNFTAPFAPDEVTAQEGIRNTAFPATQEVADWSQQAFAFDLNQGRDPATNPYFAGAINSTVDPIFRNLTENVLPQIRGGYQAAGSPGGSRQALAERGAVDVTTRNALEASTGMYNQAWQQGQNRATQALGFAPTLQSLWANPYAMLGGVGEQQRAYEQSQIDEARFREEYAQTLPYQKLAEYSNLVSQPYGAEGTSQVIAPESSTASQIAGAALTIPGLISILRGIFGGP